MTTLRIGARAQKTKKRGSGATKRVAEMLKFPRTEERKQAEEEKKGKKRREEGKKGQRRKERKGKG